MSSTLINGFDLFAQLYSDLYFTSPVEIDGPTFGAFIHLIHITRPHCGKCFFVKQLLNY